MNGNAELLNFIYQNSEMGVETIHQLLSISENKEFNHCLQLQLKEYEQINGTAKEMLNTNGYHEKEIGSFTKLRTYLAINMQTLMDKTPSHISEMMIIGSTMGIIDSVKNIRKYKGAEQNILDLMEKLQNFEENNIEQLKGFL